MILGEKKGHKKEGLLAVRASASRSMPCWVDSIISLLRYTRHPQVLTFLKSLPLTCRNQKDRTAAYLDLLSQLLSSLSSSSSTQSLIDFGAHFTTSTSTAVVVGRRVLSIYVLALCAGSGVAEKDSKPVVAAAGLEADELAEWAGKGEAAFGKGEVDEEGEDKRGEKRGEVVRGVLEKGATGWCEEQVSWSDSSDA